MKAIKCYRFVTKDLKSQSGDVQWEIGKWNKHDGELKLCASGFHACEEPLDSLNYIYGDRWHQAEARDKVLKGEDKLCSSEMRIIKEIPITVIKQFAIDCAERTLKNFEEKYPKDKRPREAIEAARKYLDDPTEENRSAARSAWSAARSAAWSAARSAAWSAAESAAWSAWSAARSAAWSAAWSAGSAAWLAGSAAERKWQNRHLKKLIREALK